MIFQSIEFTGESPFKNCLIHGLIRDSQGRKMSKSLGNGVDPMDLKDKYGTDAMRYFLTTNSAPGMDLRFDEEKILASWNYINKIWNVSRYVLMNLEEDKLGEINVEELSVPSKWILTKLNNLIIDVDTNYEKFEFGEVARSLYNFIWNDFASWYVELTKVDLQAKNEYYESTMNVLAYVLEAVIKLVHPFMPFVTEEIYQSLPTKKEASICIASWPTVNEAYNFEEELKVMDLGCDIISSVRTIRTDLNHPMSKPITLNLEATIQVISQIASIEPYIVKFTNAKKLVISEEVNKEDTVSKILPDVKIFIPAKELIDKEAEIRRLEVELNKLKGELERSNKMLSNPNFLSKANPEKIEAERAKLVKYEATYQEVLKHLEELKK
jgi:valyl-tRNA synthetase